MIFFRKINELIDNGIDINIVLRPCTAFYQYVKSTI